MLWSKELALDDLVRQCVGLDYLYATLSDCDQDDIADEVWKIMRDLERDHRWMAWSE
jgi:hypothetical protein